MDVLLEQTLLRACGRRAPARITPSSENGDENHTAQAECSRCALPPEGRPPIRPARRACMLSASVITAFIVPILASAMLSLCNGRQWATRAEDEGDSPAYDRILHKLGMVGMLRAEAARQRQLAQTEGQVPARQTA
jgi:hypothetical protein